MHVHPAKIIELESLVPSLDARARLAQLTKTSWLLWLEKSDESIFQELRAHEQRETTQMTSSRIDFFPAFDAWGCDWLLLIETSRLKDKRQ